MYENIIKNINGSYTFTKNGLPYNCPNVDEWVDEYREVNEYAEEHPDEVIIEQPPTPPTLDELKQKRLAELTSTFNTIIKGHFTTTEGYEMQFSEHDSNLLNGSITLMEKQGKTTGYLTQYNDETVYDVPLETMKNVLLQMLVRFAECHSKKQEYRTLINNAGNEEELNNIAFNFEQSNEGSSE